MRGSDSMRETAQTAEPRDFVVNSVPALMSYIGKDLRYRWANQTYAKWFGFPMDKIVGATLLEVVGPERHAIVLPRIERALAGHEVQFEGSFPMMAGPQRFLHITYTPDLDDTGAVQGIAVQGTDISETVGLRARAADSEERLRLAVAAAKLGTWEYEPQTKRLEWSGRCKELFGLRADDPIDFAKNLEGIHPDDRSSTLAAMNQALEPGGTGDYDVEFRTLGFRDGVTRWVHASGQAFFRGGLASRFVGTLEDISERKRVEEALRESEQFTRNVLESSSDCVKVIDLDGRLLSLNQAGCHLLEIDDLPARLNRPWQEFWGDDKELAERALDEARAGRSAHFEGFCPTHKGTPRWWDVVVTPIRDGAGHVIRMLSISRDITERHHAEQEHRRLTLELERSNGELSQFAHIAAHDLQSPLRMVRTYTQLLERQLRPQLTDSCRDLVRVILDSSGRMEKLISSLLDYAQAGQAERQPELVSTAAVVSEALSNLEVSIKEHDAEITCGELPVVRGDAVHLMQVFQNTVGNSIKYRRAGIPLHISIGAQLDGDRWRFAIEDNGQGIAGDYLEQVFKPFKRLHGQDIAGTGMGLAVCRRIVERHGGKMWAESEPDSGARFCFTLPAENRLSKNNNPNG